jgi:tetratricopeptide (TPR) repeat protein
MPSVRMSEDIRSNEPVEVFYSYAHKDEKLRIELDKHLSILKRQNIITGWHDRKIIGGDDWKDEIDKHLNTAKVILLLISADFLASDYCYGIEVERALERNAAGEARVIPVVLRAVYWKGALFRNLQALPTDGKAVTSWQNRDEAFTNITEGIAKAIEEIQQTNPQVQVRVVREISDLIDDKAEIVALDYQEVYGHHVNASTSEIQAKLEQQRVSRRIAQGRWRIELAGTMDDIKKLPIQDIVDQLRLITGDMQLTLLAIESGSVILVFEGARNSFELLEYLFRTGELTAIGDIRLQDVSWQPNWLANAIWNVPYRRNPDFTGREELLVELREKLTSGKAAALTQAIYGLGGVGKTQLATEYAYRYDGEYDVVWWLRAEDAATLVEDYAALAGRLELREKDARDQEVIVEAVRGWLTREQRWLLVFDNANRPEDVSKYLPGVVRGHVIITSRNPNWGGIASTLQVKVLEQAEGVEFLLSRTRQEDEESARKLSVELGGLPLALAQAGAYIEANGVTIAHYLELFQSRRAELWGEERGPLDYDKRTVSATLNLAIKHVDIESPRSVDLLNLSAFLGPDDIPLTLLSRGHEHLPELLGATVADDLEINETIGALRRYSLVEVAEKKDSLSVHRLVQAVVRDGLGEDESKVWAEAAVDVVNEVFPYDKDDVRTWGESARLLPHALATTGHIEELGILSGSAGRLLNEVGKYLRGRAQYVEAKSALERSLSIMSKVYGAKHSYYASTLVSLGTVLQELGDLEGARAHYERALAIDEKVFGLDHPTVAIDVNNLGTVLRELGDLEGAKGHLEKALAIDEKVYGPDHPTVAIRVNNLGRVLQELGDLEGAKAHYERALAIDEKVYGPDHPTVAIRVNNLGGMLQDLGDLEGAKAHYERALAIDEKVFGLDHPNVAIDVNNLSTVLRDLGDLEGAKAHYERALAIDERVFGLDHPNVAIYTNNLGRVLQELGDLEGARLYLERALAIDERVFGPDHPLVARDVNNLGMVFRELGDLEGAKGHLERALRILPKFLGEEHPNIAVVRSNLEVVMDLLAKKTSGGK